MMQLKLQGQCYGPSRVARSLIASQPVPPALPSAAPRRIGGIGSRARSLAPIVRFRSVDRPQEDPDLGSKVVAAFDDTPPEMVAEAQLRKFLGLSGSRELNTVKVASGIKGADASMTILGTIIEVNDLQHAVLCLVVKQNTNANKLAELTLHWATCSHEGAQWIPPPAGCHYYPSNLVPSIPGGGAWRTPFASHTSPDGKPLHVIMLQLPLDGLLSKGGLIFVLNNGHHWMHNPRHGRDWYVQLAGHLPITTDLEGLPDAEVFPAASEPAPGQKEAADRRLLHSAAAQMKELSKQQEAATKLAEVASKAADDAAAAKASAQADAQAAALQLQAARDTLAALRKAVVADEQAVAVAQAAVESSAQEQQAAGSGAVRAATQAAMASLEFDSDVDEEGWSFAAEAKRAEAKSKKAKANAAEARAALKAAESTLQARQAEISWAQSALNAATKSEEAAMHKVAEAQDVERHAVESARKQAAAKAVVCEGVSREVAELEAARAEAAARVWACVEGRQLLLLKRFLVETGPEQALRLNWLLPPSRSGRSLPVVPTPFNGVRNIQSSDAGDEGGKKLEPCSMQDLHQIMRAKLRKWLKVTPSQELCVIQYNCSVRLPDGQVMPVGVWLTDGQEGEADDKPYAVVVVAVDQSAAGSSTAQLQLHWGAAVREGATPAQLAGPGWRTSASHNWESSGCTMVTPFTAQHVPALGIGQKRSRGPAQPVEEAENEKHAQVALLHLPLEGMLMNGGLTFFFRDAKGRHLHNAGTGQPFFLELGLMVHQLAYITAPRLPSGAEGDGDGEGDGKEQGAGADRAPLGA